MIDLEKDLEICGAATDGVWERGYDNSDTGQWETAGPADLHYGWSASPLEEMSVQADADFIAHFNPQKVRQMLLHIKELEEVIDAITGGKG